VSKLQGRVELTCLLSRAGCELADEVFIHIANHVAMTYPRRSQLKPGVVEIFKQVLQPPVPLLGLTQCRLGVEIDVAKHVFELCLVGILDLFEGHVDEFADVWGISMSVEIIEIALLRDDESLTGKCTFNSLLISLVLLEILPLLVIPHVAQEQHREDVVLIF
jgi:hypothetical protein